MSESEGDRLLVMSLSALDEMVRRVAQNREHTRPGRDQVESQRKGADGGSKPAETTKYHATP